MSRRKGAVQDSYFRTASRPDRIQAASLLPEYPMMDDVTLQLALAGVSANELGASPNRTDLLAVSLSSTDAVGHRYGPDSREIHDQILRLDLYLGRFLDSLYTLRDSARVLLVLTADHGVTPSPDPGVMSRYRRSVGGFADIRGVISELHRALAQAGVDSNAYGSRNDVLFLEPLAFTRARISRDSVARAYAAAVRRADGVLRADVYADLARQAPGANAITRRWQHMFSPDKNAAVVVTLKPYWNWVNTGVIATHGGPHDDDARVPIIFAGAGVRPGRRDDFTRTVDIAPTIAALIGVLPSEPLDGRVLHRAIR